VSGHDERPIRMNDNDNIRRVNFAGREYKVIFAHLYVENYFDIWLMDAKTEKFTDICTELAADVSLKPGQVLIRDEFIEALTQAGVVQATGEIFDTRCGEGKLHKCDIPSREHVSVFGRHDSQEGEREPDSFHAERDVDDRDLGDEIEF
jgi:hypothetical protein